MKSPDFSCLSKRLVALKLNSPRYKKTKVDSENVVAIAIDSTGLKRFWRGEWHQEKYKLSGKRSWRKLHVAVDNQHIIHGSELTDRFSHDCKSVEPLSKQINCFELAIQRYKKILGCVLHSRDIVRQKMESIIGCGILNKMTQFGMPVSYRCA